MQLDHPTPLRLIRLLALACALSCAGMARADDYTDVNQLLRSGKSEQALAKAEQYLEGKPKDPQMRFLKGIIQTKLDKPTEAIATFTALTEDYPELPEPYNNLAALYATQNQLDKARSALETAVRINPSYAIAHDNLGDIYARMAAQSYAQALQLEPGNRQIPAKITLLRDVFTANSKTPAKPAPKQETKE